MTSTSTPTSWQNPRPLRNALTTWACRDDTRPGPDARAAADTALGIIAGTIAGLAALALRIEREIAQADAGSGYHEAAGPGHAGQTAIDDDALTHTQAEDALTAGGYSATEACRILLAAGQAGTYRDDTVTVTAAPSRPMFPRYRITAATGPLSGPQLAVVHSMAGLVHDEPRDEPRDGERDYAEEAYNRLFCDACGGSPCSWDGIPDGFHTNVAIVPFTMVAAERELVRSGG